MAAELTYAGTAISGTGGITSLATSADWTAGYEWFVVDNTTEKAFDWFVAGKVTVGTTPTINTQIRLYVVGIYDGSTYPDVLDGTPSAETWTSAGVRDSVARLAAVLIVDATTSDRGYPYAFNLASFFPSMPKKVVVFVSHNTGVALNATAGNHTYGAQPVEVG